MPGIKIRDIAVVARFQNHTNPIGEAHYANTNFPMSASGRKAMRSRLFNSIETLLRAAQDTHYQEHFSPKTKCFDSQCITRLSTNEFFFYTQEPLTLTEFKKLLNKITEKAKQLPDGIHLVLGSFAVKTTDHFVMNVTPHISSGKATACHLIVKNHTSSIDFAYKKNGYTLKPFNIDNASKYKKTLPEINIDNTPTSFTFNNIIKSQTPDGGSMITAIDVCLDNYIGVAKSNALQWSQENQSDSNLPFSHLVVSNTILMTKAHCLGFAVQIDPDHSKISCKEDSEQQERYPGEAITFFGPNKIRVYDIKPYECLTVQEAIAFNDVTIKIKNSWKIIKKLYAHAPLLINEMRTKRYDALTLENSKTLFSEMDELIQQGFIEQRAEAVSYNLLNFNPKVEELIRHFDTASHANEKVDKLNELTYFINNLSRQKLTDTILKLKALQFGKDDQHMTDFIEKHRTAFFHANTHEERQNILNTLETMHSTLHASAQIQYIKTVVTGFRKNAGFFTIGMENKASKIEQAICDIPLEERLNLETYQSVLKALASHRHWNRQTLYLNEDGSIDAEKASTSFKQFKEKFNTQRVEGTPELQVNSTNPKGIR